MEIQLNDCKESKAQALMKSQTKQAPPSAVFPLGRMHGFRFVIIPVASSLTVSCRPPPVSLTTMKMMLIL
ncbi:hypothetical protein PVL29_009068 [Vitis rotundifolia]|uniref:Uncharacterized protein n=1 Tax=Vitis rotundifolia TaxID=103349 RepID=A0AA38ZYG5_VITRO|nr:hypothetical protein PVL29_009068 [Vitis rotundifolia]